MPMLTTVLIARAGDAHPRAATNPVGEGVDRVEHLVHLGDDVGAVHDQAVAARTAQRGVQHGPVLGDVDSLAGEHRVPPGFEPDLFAQFDQGGHDVVVDEVLGQVDEEVRGR